MAEYIVLVLLVVIAIFSAFFIVDQQTCAIVERFGKFRKLGMPGLNLKIPLIEAVRSRVSLRIHQLNVEVETKTEDNVFVNIITAVQYKILDSKIYEAFYTLQDPEQQIRSFVFDLVRAQVPLLSLDDVFSKKDDIANAIKMELQVPMTEFGYEIIKALVVDINPDSNVKSAMNEINTAQRLRVAATERGEAEKILKIKQAEAEAESAVLHGKGVAGQRQAIIEGLCKSVDEFTRQTGSTADQVMDMVLIIQYIDTLKEIAASSKSNVIFVPHSPGNVSTIGEQIRETMLTAHSLGNERATKNSE